MDDYREGVEGDVLGQARYHLGDAEEGEPRRGHVAGHVPIHVLVT